MINVNQEMCLTEALEDLIFVQGNARQIVSGGQGASADQVRQYSFAMVDEVTEWAKEMGWKDWKPDPAMTDERRQRILDEFADIIAFFGTLSELTALKTGATPDEIAAAYTKKVQINLKRFAGEVEGYGVRRVVG